MERIDNWGQLRIDMMPNPNQQEAGGAGEGRSVKIVEALKPSFSLSFDNSPTELSAWLTQFKSYYDASKLHRLPLEQQQAFLRQGLAPDIWTVIKQRINIETRIFNKILSIPAQDFNLGEVNRVATACEIARNYSSLQSKNVSNKVFDKKTSNSKPSGSYDKLKALKQQGKCVRCGKNAHSKGETCPHRTTVCHKCGIKGHISKACA